MSNKKHRKQQQTQESPELYFVQIVEKVNPETKEKEQGFYTLNKSGESVFVKVDGANFVPNTFHELKITNKSMVVSQELLTRTDKNKPDNPFLFQVKETEDGDKYMQTVYPLYDGVNNTSYGVILNNTEEGNYMVFFSIDNKGTVSPVLTLYIGEEEKEFEDYIKDFISTVTDILNNGKTNKLSYNSTEEVAQEIQNSNSLVTLYNAGVLKVLETVTHTGVKYTLKLGYIVPTCNAPFMVTVANIFMFLYRRIFIPVRKSNEVDISKFIK